MVILRYVRGVHVSLASLGFGFWGTVICLIWSLVIRRFDRPETPKEITLTICMAGVTFGTQYLLGFAMKHEHAGMVAIVRSCDAVFAFLLQFLLLGTRPDLWSLIGAILITACVVMVAFRKWVGTLDDKNPYRKRFWFVLK